MVDGDEFKQHELGRSGGMHEGGGGIMALQGRVGVSV